MVDTPSGIHIPAPHGRPGDTPDFSTYDIPKAGSVDMPDPMVDATEIRDLSFGLIRVLNHNHAAVGDWNQGLSAETLRTGLKTMVMTRIMDERLQKMQRTKRLSFYMKSLGEEAVAVAAAMALRDDDMLFPSYRLQGAYLARGVDMVELMCQCISNECDPLKGRQLPIHYSDKSRNWFSISGNLATQFPQAVGWSMANAIRGEDKLAASWIGEGSSSEGDFHSACTLASTYKAPVILNVVNNQWAISMFQGISGGASETFASKAIGYGIPGIRVDGNDFLAVHAVTAWAAERARRGGGPTLIESYTYRGEAHSTSDDPSRYRPKDEWKAWPLGDPVERLKQHLIGEGEWSEADHMAYEKDSAAHVKESWKEAISYGTLEEGPHAPVRTMFDDVFAEQPWHIRRQRQELGH